MGNRKERVRLAGWGSNDFITKMAQVLPIQPGPLTNSLCGHLGVTLRPGVHHASSHQQRHSVPSPQLWTQTSGRHFYKQNLPSKEKICHHLGNSVSEGSFQRKFPKRFWAVTGLSYSFFKGTAGWEHRNSGMFIQSIVILSYFLVTDILNGGFQEVTVMLMKYQVRWQMPGLFGEP